MDAKEWAAARILVQILAGSLGRALEVAPARAREIIRDEIADTEPAWREEFRLTDDEALAHTAVMLRLLAEHPPEESP